MKRDDWSGLATFATVAEAGSFTKAAMRLGVSPSALSHAMRALEERVGVRLLNRTTRSVAPTDAGERLLARLRPAMEDVADALRDMDTRRTRPTGRLRISAHRTAVMHAILPRMAAFAETYPEVTVELVLDDGWVDIVAGRFDAGVRPEKVIDKDMISVRISARQRIAVVATPLYFARFGTPGTPEDMRQHRCLNYRYTSSGSIYEWSFAKDDQNITFVPPTALISNDSDVLLEGALLGVGVAYLSESQVLRYVQAGALVRVLADWSPMIPPNYLYYPSRRQMSPAMRGFIEAIRHNDRETEVPE